jgi:GNAT superfamily N-acetyltransferase
MSTTADVERMLVAGLADDARLAGGVDALLGHLLSTVGGHSGRLTDGFLPEHVRRDGRQVLTSGIVVMIDGTVEPLRASFILDDRGEIITSATVCFGDASRTISYGSPEHRRLSHTFIVDPAVDQPWKVVFHRNQQGWHSGDTFLRHRPRPAVAEDGDFLFAVFAQTMRTVIEQTWGWDPAWQRTEFDRRFAAHDASVVEAGGRPIGWLLLERSDESIFIHELQLLPEYQGQGLGTAIVQDIVEQAGRRGVPVELSVVPANPRAQQLYERLGFEVVAIDAPFIRMRRDTAGCGDA